MIKINLLPHREARRKQKIQDFYNLLVLAAMLGVLVLILVGFYNQNSISIQNSRNTILKNENAKLDEEIKEIATLKDQIEGLKARQQAVEDLQSDRNQPVYLLSELVSQTPEGRYLRSVKQDGQRVILQGYAQSNERVSEYLTNLISHSDWLNKPDLIEIRSTGLGQGKDAKKVFDFTINVGINRPRDLEDLGGAPTSAPKTGNLPKAPVKP